MNRSIQEKVISEAADQFAKEIDFEVLAGAMVESGWVKVVLKPLTWEDGLEIDGWVDKNVKDKFMTMGLVWVFKNPKEANWFKLRWLG